MTGAPWEAVVGYCRAIRVGPQVWVSGTAPVEPDGTTTAPGDVYAQTLRCLEIIDQALGQSGAALTDVVRTRIFVVNIADWQEVGRAHGEYFGEIRPATTLVEVSALIAPDMLVEIEAEAVVAGEPAADRQS
jgi:enamine deaminase RidA (YjgF/YER057c/UK114 family)